ncbi:MAG: type II toxin-antitoxin system HicB family antitoxin [Deltaproteobacteria bacterium]|nr:type II toxin-antitoxin system HicB family antitoxin [Deltaproteobacteria bacterium]
MKYPYEIKVFFDFRDQIWVAVSDDLPGCSAGGATPVEALQEFELAVEAWIEALESTGKSLPIPKGMGDGSGGRQSTTAVTG